MGFPHGGRSDMTRLNLTPAQAKALGVKLPATERSTRKTVPAKDCLGVRCAICLEPTERETAMRRHLEQNPTHRRYEAVLDRKEAT